MGALTSWALEGSVVTGDSMRARGYGIAKRSSFMIYRMTWANWILLVVILVSLSATVAAACFGQCAATFVPVIHIAPISWGLAAYICYLLIPPALHLWESVCYRLSLRKI